MNSNNGTLLDEVIVASRKIVLEDEEDYQGVTNQDKWEAVRRNLPEIREKGFLADINYADIYANEVGGRLLAYVYLSGLQTDAFDYVLMDRAHRGLVEGPEGQAIDILYHQSLLTHKKLRDKWNALAQRKKEWTHSWIN